jgi:Rod binding domain-containing protein
VNQALEPAWVRHGSPTTQRDYATALAFERTLVEQLSKSMTAAGQSGEEGSPEGESGGAMGAGLSQFSSMLPPALSSSVMSSGGLGLAAQLTRAMQGPGSAAPHSAGSVSPETGGTSPGGTAS